MKPQQLGLECIFNEKDPPNSKSGIQNIKNIQSFWLHASLFFDGKLLLFEGQVFINLKTKKLDLKIQNI